MLFEFWEMIARMMIVFGRLFKQGWSIVLKLGEDKGWCLHEFLCGFLNHKVCKEYDYESKKRSFKFILFSTERIIKSLNFCVCTRQYFCPGDYKTLQLDFYFFNFIFMTIDYKMVPNACKIHTLSNNMIFIETHIRKDLINTSCRKFLKWLFFIL